MENILAKLFLKSTNRRELLFGHWKQTGQSVRAFLCLSLERLLCIIFRSPNALCLRDALLPSACFAALLPLLCSVIFIHTQSRIWQRRIFTSLVLINNHLSNPPSTIEIKTLLPIILWSCFLRPSFLSIKTFFSQITLKGIEMAGKKACKI